MIELIDFKGEHSPLKVSFQLKEHLILQFELPQKLTTHTLNELGDRKHELWKGTCFECFILYSHGQYDEWNFDLKGNWQSYRFTKYRSPAPPRESSLTPHSFQLERGYLKVELPFHSEVIGINPTVILEGDRFFAHSHPKTGADFHNSETYIIL